MGCGHEISVSAKFGTPYYDTEEGKFTQDWIPAHKVTAFVDIDLHRMKCSICGEIGYYSNAARKFFEEGITSNIKGLNGGNT
jgi:hypothetical protein